MTTFQKFSGRHADFPALQSKVYSAFRIAGIFPALLSNELRYELQYEEHLLSAPNYEPGSDVQLYKVAMDAYTAQQKVIRTMHLLLQGALPDQDIQSLELQFPLGANIAEIWSYMKKKYGTLTFAIAQDLLNELTVPCASSFQDYLYKHISINRQLTLGGFPQAASSQIFVFREGLKHEDWTHSVFNSYLNETDPDVLTLTDLADRLQIYYDRVSPVMAAHQALKVAAVLPALPDPRDIKISKLERQLFQERKKHQASGQAAPHGQARVRPPFPPGTPLPPAQYCPWHKRHVRHSPAECDLNPANA